jgi:hypothetical protein
MILTDVILHGGVSASDGNLSIVASKYPGRNSASISHGGRDARVYEFDLVDTTRSDLEAASRWAGDILDGQEIFPFDADRSVYVAFAQGLGVAPSQIWDSVAGAMCNEYTVKIKAQCREPWMLGPEQGIPFTNTLQLPTTSNLTNAGSMPSGIDFLWVSGGYDETDYTSGLTVRILPTEVDQGRINDILLCDKLMRNDCLELDYRGRLTHSYETTFPRGYSGLKKDLQGITYCDLGESARVEDHAMYMGAGSRLLLPFYGPIPVTAHPKLEFDITDVAGDPEIQLALSSDLSDLAAIDHDSLEIGTNEIYIPDCVGEGFVAFGIVTDIGESIQLSRLAASVRRDLPASRMPLVDVDDEFILRLEDSETSNHVLTYGMVDYRDRFW